jgi:hypothetical protein
MYPATKLPLILDAFQFKLICDDDTALAVRSVGDGSTGSTGLLGITGTGVGGITGTGTGGIGITGTGTGVEIGGNMFPSPEVVDVRDFVSGPS